MTRHLLVFLGAHLLLLLAPSVSAGSPVLDIDCQNSRAIYGVEARHIESYGCWMYVDGERAPDVDEWFTQISWFHTSPTLQQLTLETDANGAVIRSHYAYTGGVFELEFRLENEHTGERVIGSAVMPILSMDVFSDEGGDPDYGHVEMFATLGAGKLDAAIAHILGVGQNVVGGKLSDPFLARRGPRERSGYTDDFREASEGGPNLLVEIPEPPLLTLVAFGIAAARRRLT